MDTSNKMSLNAKITTMNNTSAWDDDDWHSEIVKPVATKVATKVAPKVATKVAPKVAPKVAAAIVAPKVEIKQTEVIANIIISNVESEDTTWEDNELVNVVEDKLVDTSVVDTGLVENELVDTIVVDTGLVDNELVDTGLVDDELVEDELVEVKKEPSIFDLVRYRFDEMNLTHGLLRGIFADGKEIPSECQKYIPLLIELNRDVIAQGATGSGKTLLYLVALIEFVLRHGQKLTSTLGIIIAHSRELAMQIFQAACIYTQFTNVSVALHRGAGRNTTDVERYMTNSKPNVRPGEEQIIIATPGRLLELLTSEKRIRLTESISINRLRSDLVGMLVIDEADDLLKLQNNEQIIEIFESIKSFDRCKKIIISATIPKILLQICNNFLVSPIEILLTNEEISKQSSINHYYVEVSEEYKLECLIDLIEDKLSTSIAQIFFNKTEKAIYIYNELLKRNYSVACMHGDLSQKERDEIMMMFKKGRIRLLLSTDLIARGIDMPSVSCVFNWDLPMQKMETYQHRAGRCGRYNKKGSSIILSSNLDEIKKLAGYNNLRIEPLPHVIML